MCADNLDDSTPTGRCWFDLYECHYLTSCAKSISCPGFNRIYALRTLLRRPSNRPKRFCLPFWFRIDTRSTCTLNSSSIAALTSVFVASCITRNATWSCFSPIIVLFSDTTGPSSTAYRRSFLPLGIELVCLVALIPTSPRAWRLQASSQSLSCNGLVTADPHSVARRSAHA